MSAQFFSAFYWSPTIIKPRMTPISGVIRGLIIVGDQFTGVIRGLIIVGDQ